MIDPHEKDGINAAVLQMFNVFQGRLDVSDSTILVMAILALKYLSDTNPEVLAQSQPAVQLRSQVPEEANFYALHTNRNNPGNGVRLDTALQLLESCNDHLQGMFLSVSFDSPRLGSEDQKQRTLCRLLEATYTSTMNFRVSTTGKSETFAYASEAVLKHAADMAGKKGAEYFTPIELSLLLARLMQPRTGESIYDPFCGAASTLITCNQLARDRFNGDGGLLFGQEMNGNTLGLAKMNLLLHNETCQLAWGDTLRSPHLFGSNKLRSFDIVVSHPPFSLREWGFEWASHDPFERFRRGIPPKASGDFACISHMLASLSPVHGRMAVIVSLGVLFRSGAEHQIRHNLIEDNLIDAVIALPPKLLANTGIPTAILILRKDKRDDGILFIDASNDYQQGKASNTLRETDLNRIESTYRTRESTDQYSKLASKAELVANDHNLSVSRYVEIRSEEEKIDLKSLRAERDALRVELEQLEIKLTMLLKEISNA